MRKLNAKIRACKVEGQNDKRKYEETKCQEHKILYERNDTKVERQKNKD